jgi:replicative DNA helicase
MLVDAACVGPALSRVSARDFTAQQYRSIFEAIRALFRAGMPTDPICVREKLGGDANSWTKLLQGILDMIVTTANFDGYIQLLKESSTLYQLQELGDTLKNAATLDDARGALDKGMQLMVGRPGIQAMTYAEGYEQFFERHSGETAVEFLDWAILQLNEVLQAELGNVIIIGAYPSDGKTALALQCADRFGLKHKVGYFSFESKKERLYDRTVSRTALISGSKIAANKLDEDDYREILDLKDKLLKPNVTIIDASGMTALDIIAYSQAKHFDIIFVDYLQQVEQPPGPYMKDFERVTAVSRELQRFAVRTDTTVISLSQLSRPDKVKFKYKGDDGQQHIRSITPPPTMGDLRSSGQIEQDADIILLMWREDYDLKDSPRVIQVAKNRHGEALDKVRCRFDGDHQTFTRMEPRKEPAPVKKERQKPRQVSFWADGSDFQEVPADKDNPFTQEVKHDEA